jgi:hypothetical protein
VERTIRRYGDSIDGEAHLLDDVVLSGAALTTPIKEGVGSSWQNGWTSQNGTARAMHARRTIVAGVIACFLFRPVVAIVGGRG